MNRYLSSFILTVFIFSSLFATTVFLSKDQDISKSSKEITKDIHRVKVSLVEAPKNKVQKKIIKKEKKVIEKKSVKKVQKTLNKKIVKKKVPPKKKIEKIVKKEKNKTIKKQVEKKEIIVKKEKKTKNLTPQKIASKTIKKDKNIEAKKIKKLQNKYFAQISQTINKNKFYPKRAILRHLQDDIKIEFLISPKGELLSFNITQGKKIFHKSTKKAIEKSFPIAPPNGVLSSNTKVKLTLAYRLN